MAYELERVVVFDQRLYPKSGLVGRWMLKLTASFTLNAVKSAPMRTGELRAGISGTSRQIGERQVEGLIESSSSHTMYVLKGTRTPIRTTLGYALGPSKAYKRAAFYLKPGGGWSRDPSQGVFHHYSMVPAKGMWLKLQPARGGYPINRQFEVRGQRANNFLLKAWDKTAVRHPALRGAVAPPSIHF